MISKEEVRRIAELARLNLSKDEESKFSKELSSILDYVKELEKIDTAGVDPTSHPFESRNVEREDEGMKKSGQDKMFSSAPDKEKGYLKVKTILEKKNK